MPIDEVSIIGMQADDITHATPRLKIYMLGMYGFIDYNMWEYRGKIYPFGWSLL